MHPYCVNSGTDLYYGKQGVFTMPNKTDRPELSAAIAAFLKLDQELTAKRAKPGPSLNTPLTGEDQTWLKACGISWE